jgi:ribosomal protein L11 methyltransferase
MKIYLEITIPANQDQRDLLIPTMVELGCQGFQETDNSLLCYIDKSRWSDEKDKLLKERLGNLLQTISSNTVTSFREFADINWNEEWEKTIQPIEVGDKLVIKPSWCEYTGSCDRIIIQIDPKMSFGTGYHETTRLTLRLIEKYLTPACSVLDVGTGTGILAIAAIKLGARSAIGIDNDEWSIDNAQENVHANRVDGAIRISSQNINALDESEYDLVTANLTLNTNIEFMSEFKRLLKKDGTLLLSGLLSLDENIMKLELAKNNFSVLEIVRENEWIAIASKMSG